MPRPLRNLLLSATALLGLAGCEGGEGVAEQSARALRSKVGYFCTVQFRRDALGGATANPVPPTTNSFNGAQVSLTGVLRDVRGDWLVIEEPGAGGRGAVERWIPTRSVLLLEWSPGPAR